MFVAEMFIFMTFLCLVVFSPNFVFLVVCLFGMGLALGCDYPTAHLIISESTPSRVRGRLVLSAFGFQALGALTGTAVGYLVLMNIPDLGAWRWMYATAIIPGVIVTVGRFFITESPQWLFARDRVDDATRETMRLLRRTPAYPHQVKLEEGAESRAAQRPGYATLFNTKNRRATILASVPWFLQDLGTYGIGIFTPTILAASIGHKTAHARSVADLVTNDVLAAKGRR